MNAPIPESAAVLPAPDDDIAALWQAFWRAPHSLEALDRLIAAHAGFARKVLGRMMIRLPSHVKSEDLFNSALIGLHDAILRFDPRQGISFEAFATRRIRGAIVDELRACDPLTRTQRNLCDRVAQVIEQWTVQHGGTPSHEEIAQTLDMTAEAVMTALDRGQPWLSLDASLTVGDGELRLSDVLAENSAFAPDQQAHVEEMRVLLRKAFRQLADRERKILYLYYYEDLRLREIAELFEMTEARICQIHALTVAKLRHVLAAME